MKGALRLAAVCRAAAGVGLKAGMALADARALQPDLRVAEADRDAEHALLESIVDWARRYTPLAALDGADGVMLDITGCAHLFGGEAAMLADALNRLEFQGFSRPAGAIAATPEAAWALARFGAPAQRVCPPGGEQQALRPLPVAALNLPPAVADGLKIAGLSRVEDLWLRPRAPIAARFGPGVVDRLEAAFGVTRSAIAPRLEAAPYMAERRFADPILTMADVDRTLGRLTGEIAAMLTRHGEGARRLQVMLFRVDGASFRIEAGLSRPSREAGALAQVFREKLSIGPDERDVGYGFDVIRLSAIEVARLDPEAARLDSAPGHEDVARLIDRLAARLGTQAMRHFVARDAHHPEAASVMQQAVGGGRPFASVNAGAAPWNPTRRPGEPPDRPVLLLEQPEMIETVAAVPDGPPMRFRWRHVLHEVTASEGPERIALPWWGERQAPTRDYFKTEDREGRRFWLYREGLYGRETHQPRWFVHGLFG